MVVVVGLGGSKKRPSEAPEFAFRRGEMASFHANRPHEQNLGALYREDLSILVLVVAGQGRWQIPGGISAKMVKKKSTGAGDRGQILGGSSAKMVNKKTLQGIKNCFSLRRNGQFSREPTP